jgi:hypothetical protein
MINLDTKWDFKKPQPLYSKEANPGPINEEGGGLQNRSGWF